MASSAVEFRETVSMHDVVMSQIYRGVPRCYLKS